MLTQLIRFFLSGFIFPGITPVGLAWGIGLGILFGAIWLVGYWPPLFKRPWLWAVLAASAILPWAAASFIQIPLQAWTGQALGYFWDQKTLMRWILLAGIPQILLSGLVQEGAKLLPTVIYWLRSGRTLEPKVGLVIGAVAGAGFGVFEAVWAHNRVFAQGWTWAATQTAGLVALAPFWERFFVVGLHIAVAGLGGYGLAKGRGWQFYLLASLGHALANYAAVLAQARVVNVFGLEAYIAVVAVVFTVIALSLRWRKPKAPAAA